MLFITGWSFCYFLWICFPLNLPVMVCCNRTWHSTPNTCNKICAATHFCWRHEGNYLENVWLYELSWWIWPLDIGRRVCDRKIPKSSGHMWWEIITLVIVQGSSVASNANGLLNQNLRLKAIYQESLDTGERWRRPSGSNATDCKKNSDIGNNLPLIYNHLLSCGLGPIFNTGCGIRLSPLDTAV